MLVIGYSMAAIGVLLILLSLVLTVIWKVPSLMDELSGRKAKRQIERMRKLNLASSAITDTSEFYKSMSTYEPIVDSSEVFEDIQMKGSELSKLVDDPYGTVGNNKVSNINVSNNVVNTDETATELFDTEPKGLNIKVIEEQSSL